MFKLRHRLVLSLILIIILGTILRFVGIYPGYNPYHADENMSYSTAWQMFVNRSYDPQRYDYPSLVPLINLIFFVLLFSPIYWLKYLLFHIDILPSLSELQTLPPQVIFGNGELHALFWSRLVTAFASSTLLVLVYLTVVKAFKSRVIGILSALFLAVNYKVVLNSHFGLPDIYNVLFFYLVMFFCFNLLEKPTTKNYLLTGLAIALSFSTKYQFFGLFPFLIIHFYLSWQVRKDKKELFTKIFSKKFFVVTVIIPIIFILLNPYLFLNWQKFIDSNQYTILKYSSQRSVVYGLSYLFFIGLTPPIFITAVFGLLISLKQNLVRTIIFVSLPAVFLYTILIKIGGTGYTRNYVSVIPFILVFSAQFFNWLLQFLSINLRKVTVSLILITILITATLAESINNDLVLISSYTQPWEMTSLNNWINQQIKSGNLKSGKKIKLAAHQWDFSTILSKPSDINNSFERLPLGIPSLYSLAELQGEGAEFALLGLDVVNTENSWWMTKQDSLGFNFWQKRIPILKNQFVSLAVDELSRYTLYSAIKPWQAPDNNYLFIKIPAKIDFSSHEILSFNFDNARNWQKVTGGVTGDFITEDSDIGHFKNGSLKFRPFNSKYPVVRAISPVFQVFGYKRYKITGWVKAADKLNIKNRDGFLRLDFYDEVPAFWDVSTNSLQSDLSERYYGGDWKQLEVTALAPSTAKFATISFQVSSSNTTTFWLDDIAVSEDNGLTKVKESHTNYRIPKGILYPYSQGGL